MSPRATYSTVSRATGTVDPACSADTGWFLQPGKVLFTIKQVVYYVRNTTV